MKPPFDPAMSDGCSVPRRLRGIIPALEEQCERCRAFCIEHDRAYYEGGTEDDRRAADGRLYDSIRTIIGERWALEWYAALRVGGYTHWGTGRTWDGRALWAEAGTEAP